MQFEEDARQFIRLAAEYGVGMIMIGGGAVNFHGYMRHSADIDFWVYLTSDNLAKLKSLLREMGYAFDDFPLEVWQGKQNISLKISPLQEIELITQFNPGKTFEEAWQEAEVTNLKGEPKATYRVLSFSDLIESKSKMGRPKDLLDISELKRINGS